MLDFQIFQSFHKVFVQTFSGFVSEQVKITRADCSFFRPDVVRFHELNNVVIVTHNVDLHAVFETFAVEAFGNFFAVDVLAKLFAVVHQVFAVRTNQIELVGVVSGQFQSFVDVEFFAVENFDEKFFGYVFQSTFVVRKVENQKFVVFANNAERRIAFVAVFEVTQKSGSVNVRFDDFALVALFGLNQSVGKLKERSQSAQIVGACFVV